jgi:YHS domain-containing protein
MPLVVALCLIGLGCASAESEIPSCPVCGAVVNPRMAKVVRYAGRNYYVDSDECYKEFWLHSAEYSGARTRHVSSK